ncbi:MAG: glycosyltransferase [Clostridia bacterium]|nr:glycosyltransferase [Clostridia bacterium]
MDGEKDLLTEWRKSSPEERDAAFSGLCGQYGLSALIRNIARFHPEPEKLSPEDLPFVRRKPGKIRTIGIYYIWLKPGGVQRVMLYMAELYLRMGYRVVIITDQERSGTDYPLPENLRRIVLSADAGLSLSDRAARRADLWEKVIRENGIDLIDYNAWTSENAFWDFMAIRYSGAGVLMHTHSIAVYGMRESLPLPLQVLSAARLADAVAVLNRMDVQYYRRANRNVYWIPNPRGRMNVPDAGERRVGNHVLWCGRISPEKDPVSAVRAFALVHEAMPEARLTLVGGSNSGEWYPGIVKREIDRLNLSECVTMTGMVHDVEKYYGQADVLICTSEYEGFGLTLMEAAEFSLPIVTFDMPYLEILRRVPAIQRVPQKNKKALAERILRLLRDGGERIRLGNSVRDQMAEIEDMDLAELWRAVLKSVEEGTERPEEDLTDPESAEILIDTMLAQYAEGAGFTERRIRDLEEKSRAAEQALEGKNREAEQLCRRLKALEAREEAGRQERRFLEEKVQLYEHSLSLRAGRILTKPVRAVRGLLRRGGK